MDILKYCSELDSIMSESPKKKKLLKESSVKKPVKNSQKNRRINENYGNDGYMYLTKHGLGPGTLPKDAHLLKAKDLPHYMTAIWLDRFLTTDELKKFDIYPETEIRRVMDFYDISERDLLGESCNTKRKNRKSLKEDSNKYIDKIIVELDDEDGDYAYEVRGNKLHNKYGFYQGVIILEDDESQERLKKLGIKPGDEFVVGIRKPTPEEQEMYDDAMDDTFYMTDILYRYNESLKRNKKPLKEEYNWAITKVPEIGITYPELVDEMEQYGIDIVNDSWLDSEIIEYLKDIYNIHLQDARKIANIIVNNCYDILNEI